MSAVNHFSFFLHDTTVHNPYEPPKKYRKLYGALGDEINNLTTDREYLDTLASTSVPLYEKKGIELLYAQEIKYLDDLLKNFVKSIPKEILATSVIMFTSDHGDSFGDHNNTFNHGKYLYDDQIHIPLMIKTPRNAGILIETPVSLLDLSPTVLSFFGIPIPESYQGLVLPSNTGGELLERVIIADGNKSSFNPRELLVNLDGETLNKKLLDPHQETLVRATPLSRDL